MSEKVKTLALLDSMNEEGRISYDAYAELHDAVTSIEESSETEAESASLFEYAYGETRVDGKPRPRVHRTYQSLKQFIASGYNFPGSSWRRRVGPWRPIDPETGEPNG